MNFSVFDIPSPREKDLYFHTSSEPPKGWHAVKVEIDWDIAGTLGIGHEMGLCEEVLLRRLVMARSDWHGVPEHRPQKFSYRGFRVLPPSTRELTLYLTCDEFEAFSKVAGERGISWLANAICAAILWDGKEEEKEVEND